ncbi:MAG: hypothetical protein J0H68_06995 [Sphingobacteriia bacterium]|nr:hypothetical protein [Sphingobacteriia bacterium]
MTNINPDYIINLTEKLLNKFSEIINNPNNEDEEIIEKKLKKVKDLTNILGKITNIYFKAQINKPKVEVNEESTQISDTLENTSDDNIPYSFETYKNLRTTLKNVNCLDDLYNINVSKNGLTSWPKDKAKEIFRLYQSKALRIQTDTLRNLTLQNAY